MSKPGAQLTREMRRKEKELDEMRKLGNAPAAQDEDGKCVSHFSLQMLAFGKTIQPAYDNHAEACWSAISLYKIPLLAWHH